MTAADDVRSGRPGRQHLQERPDLSRHSISSPSLEDVLRAYTLNGAYVMMQEDVTGTIEAVKFADFIVLDRNLLEIPPEDIGETQVELTVFEGERV